MTADEQSKLGANAERDLRRQFCRLGLSLPVDIESVDHDLKSGTVTTHWVKPSTWIKVLLKRCPHVLFGEGKATEQCAAFWSLYRQHDAGHAVFSRRTKEELMMTIPLLVYGDEGRGPKRGNFLVWSLESPIGLKCADVGTCACAEESRLLPEFPLEYTDAVEAASVDDVLRASRQDTNYAGHSFLTKHLLFGIPHWAYKQKPAVIQTHLHLIQKDLCMLFEDGILFQGDFWIELFQK